MPEVRRVYRLQGPETLEHLTRQLNLILQQIGERMDQMEGRRGIPEFFTAPVSHVAAVDGDELPLYSQLSDHTDDTDNPHNVTADQVAYTPAGFLQSGTVEDALREVARETWGQQDRYLHDWEVGHLQGAIERHLMASGYALDGGSIDRQAEELSGDVAALHGRYTYGWEAPYAEGVLTPNGTQEWEEEDKWDDLQGDVSRLATVGVGVPTLVQVNSTPIYALEMTNEAVEGNEKKVFATYQLPHKWNRGPTKLHVHLITGNRTPATDEYVRWEYNYIWSGDGSVVSGAGDTVTTDVLIPSGTAPYTRLYLGVAQLTPAAGTEESSICGGLLRRKSSHANDTFEESVFLEWGDKHYKSNKRGTIKELAG